MYTHHTDPAKMNDDKTTIPPLENIPLWEDNTTVPPADEVTETIYGGREVAPSVIQVSPKYSLLQSILRFFAGLFRRSME